MSRSWPRDYPVLSCSVTSDLAGQPSCGCRRQGFRGLAPHGRRDQGSLANLLSTGSWAATCSDVCDRIERLLRSGHATRCSGQFGDLKVSLKGLTRNEEIRRGRAMETDQNCNLW